MGRQLLSFLHAGAEKQSWNTNILLRIFASILIWDTGL